MAELCYKMDPGTSEASTNLDQVKNVKDSLSSRPHQIDPSQTKIINPKHSKQEPKLSAGRNVSSDQEDAEKNSNEISKIIMRRCELFEETVETEAQRKLEINKALVEDPKGGKATKFVDVAVPMATFICCLAGGITIAIDVATFGAVSFVKIVDKHFKQANAKVIEKVVATAIDKAKMSSVLNCIVKEVAKELCRIFEYQLFQLKNNEQVEILATCAVKLMLDLKNGDSFDRNTLLKKVLQDGRIRKQKILTRMQDIKWSAPNVFRKPGLRRIMLGKNGGEFTYFVKPKACETWKYGYRGQILEMKRRQKEEEDAMDETHNEDPCEGFCKECPPDLKNSPSAQFFGESDIDSQYTESQDEILTYHPIHVLIQCPKVLRFFNQLLEEKPSLASFLKSKLGLPEHHPVYPVYRPHSPGRVPDLQKSDLTGSDFSHSDFTGSCLKECNFTRCVMLFANLTRATMCRSVFCKTLISHSDLKDVDAKFCVWTETSVLYSRVDRMDLRGMVNYGGAEWVGTNNDKAIKDKPTRINVHKEKMRLKESSWHSEVSSPNEEIWLDEFRRIRKSKKLTIETYHSMLQSLKIVRNLVCDNVEICQRESTLYILFREIQRDLNNISRDPASANLETAISFLKSAVDWLKNWSIQADDDQYKLQQSMTTSEMAFKQAYYVLQKMSEDKILAAKLAIISKVLLNLTEPEAAVVGCLQSLQELHDLHTIREVFSSLDRKEAKTTFLEQDALFAKSVLKINKILFEFVRVFFKPPPTVEEWPATINTLDEQIFNPLIDGRLLEEWLMDAGMAVSGEMNLGNGEVNIKVEDRITDVAGYSVPVIESSGQTNNSITIDQKGGCFSLSVASAFLLFPPHAVEEQVTLTFSRVRHKDCEVKPGNGDVFVSRILKIEPEGVMFKKPVTVFLSHSLDEDQDCLYFYELIVENLSPTGWQELKTEQISSIEDVPKEISNKEILDDCLPFAKVTIYETCTLVAATRAKFNHILIPTNRSYVFSKQYGDSAELKITFPPGVTEKILSLKVQLFPADAVLNKEIRVDKSFVCAPVIRVSGQTTRFLKAVDVQLTYSHSDVTNIEEEFLPVGKTIPLTTKYGLMLFHNHQETESKSDCQALNESNDVSIERLRKDQLKISFSVKHFSDVQSMVRTSSISYGPQTNADMGNMNKYPACHSAIVLAVHETGSSSNSLHAVLAPKDAERRLHNKWKVKGSRFMTSLKCNEPIYFCVPMSDTTESHHLPLKDHTLWFDPEDESELTNNTNDSVDLQGKNMRFLKDRECDNGKNHTTQGDCRAKVSIHTSESRSVQVRGGSRGDQSDHATKESTESPEVVPDSESAQGRDVSSDQEDAKKNSNKTSEVIMHRCELFEKTVEAEAQKKLEINGELVKDPKGGKATEFVDVAGPVATFICCLVGGITINVATFGAVSFATALAVGVPVVIKIVDKHKQQANAKVLEKLVATENEKIINVSSYINCIVKEVAKELSRMFEYQLSQLKNNEQVQILAKCAVKLMLDLKKGDSFDRDTLLKKVLRDGRIRKRKILRRMQDIEWSAPNVFRKAGLRRMIFGKDGFKYFVKPKACKTWKYGYRDQFLEMKLKRRQNDEAAMDETHSEDPCDVFRKQCSPDYENCSVESDIESVESDIDSQYIESREEILTYHPMHVLIQCPNVLHSFSQLQEEKPSLASFLKSKLGIPEHHLVRPVYRPHSPAKVPDLQKSDLTGSDFSHSDFTGSRLEECNFTGCVMLHANLTKARMCRSKFCKTFISHSNLEKVDARCSNWRETSILYSRADDMDISGMRNYGGIKWDGTNHEKVIEDNPMDVNETNNSNPREGPSTVRDRCRLCERSHQQ